MVQIENENIIDMTEEVIPYREHIRKIVEASTVYERNIFDPYSEAMRVLRENPTTRISCLPRYIAIGGILFIFGIAITMYSFLV